MTLHKLSFVSVSSISSELDNDVTERLFILIVVYFLGFFLVFLQTSALCSGRRVRSWPDRMDVRRYINCLNYSVTVSWYLLRSTAWSRETEEEFGGIEHKREKSRIPFSALTWFVLDPGYSLILASVQLAVVV